MKTIVFILLASFFALAQETDEETLSLPSEDPAPAAQQTTGSASVQSSQIKSSDAKKPDLSSKKEKNDVGAVLDFEGEVIEGERRRPDLFLQISIDNVKFDSLIYNRDDFNDYLDTDRNSRNRFFRLK